MLIAHPCELISLFVVCSCFSWFCLGWSLEGPDSPRISSSRPCKKSPAQTQSCRSLSPSQALASSARVHQHLTTIKNHSLETPPPHPRGAQADCAPHERTVGAQQSQRNTANYRSQKPVTLPVCRFSWREYTDSCRGVVQPTGICRSCLRLELLQIANLQGCQKLLALAWEVACCRRACNPELPFPLTLLDASRSTRVPFLASRQPRAF